MCSELSDKVEHTLPARAVKRLRVVLSDSVKSVIKAKDKLQKACKRASNHSQITQHNPLFHRLHLTSLLFYAEGFAL